jgi:uncharacterized SAM-binding protein YcdF (DUF218 family)
MSMSPLVKAALTPGSIAFLFLCLVVWIGLKLVWPRNRRVARIWLLGVAGTYIVLGLPPVANAIVGALPPVDVADPFPGRGIDTLVVLDGDNRVGRVRTALSVHGARPAGAILVLGEAWILDELVAAGIPPALLSQVEGPGTTRAQIAWVAERARMRPADRMVLIASRLQMPRVAALARARSLRLQLVPSPIDIEPPTSGFWQAVPSYVALRASRDALYEHAALVYYRRRGWISR